MDQAPQEIGQGVEQTIMYTQRVLSFIPGVAYSHQFATPEARLRTIYATVQNDALLLQQARIKIEQDLPWTLFNSKLQKDRIILQAERDLARIEMQQVKRELESYEKNTTAPPAQNIPLPTPFTSNATRSAQTAVENEPAACVRNLHLEKKIRTEAWVTLERTLQLAKDEDDVVVVSPEENWIGSGSSITQIKLQESEDQKSNLAEELMEAKAMITDVANEIEMLKSTVQKFEEHQIKTKPALKMPEAIEMARTIMAHQDLIMKEWQDRTEASKSRVKDLEAELEEPKRKYTELEIRGHD
ncbi:hypothetical protein BGZ92_005370, partial [Podila epicladia]